MCQFALLKLLPHLDEILVQQAVIFISRVNVKKCYFYKETEFFPQRWILAKRAGKSSNNGRN